jgi:hypothetical protein
MDSNSQPPANSDCSRKVKQFGWELIAYSLAMMFIAVMNIPNLGNRGEIASGKGVVSVAYFCIFVWAQSTGFGLLRFWRLARVSMLVIGILCMMWGMLTTGLLMAVMVEIGRPYDQNIKQIGLWSVLIAIIGLLPFALGFRWFRYFRRDDVRSTFG